MKTLLSRISCTALVAVASAASAATQATSDTMPVGMDKTEGNAVFYHWGAANGRSLTGIGDLSRPRSINQIAFRRNGTSNAGAARTLDVEVILSDGNLNYVVADADLIHGARKTVVLKATGVKFPDWSANAGSPAPFDFVLKFTKPFVYIRGDLVWQVRYTNPSQTGLAQMDREWTGPTGTTGVVAGAGCGSFTHTLRLENNGSGMAANGMRMRINATGAKPNAPTWLMLDFKASNITVPGLCSKLYALPTVFLPLPATNAAGGLPFVYVGFPYIVGLQGASFTTQLLSLDTSQTGLPFLASNGRTATMPINTSTTSRTATYMWTSLPTLTGTCFFGGSVIAELK